MIQCTSGGKDGWKLIAQLSNFIAEIKPFFLSRTVLRIVLYGLIAGAVFLVWLLSKGEGVAFLYSEF